MNDLLSYQPIN